MYVTCGYFLQSIYTNYVVAVTDVLPRGVAIVRQGHVAHPKVVVEPQDGQVTVYHVAALETDHDANLAVGMSIFQSCSSE